MRSGMRNFTAGIEPALMTFRCGGLGNALT
jgi:hypothetical protein